MFKTDIFKNLNPKRNVKFDLVGLKLPTNQDYYFISKWHEIFERYCTARVYLRKTMEDNWDYWFNPLENPSVQTAMELTFKSDLYETALINYNILVDLSWTITYVSAEYALYQFDKNGNITNAQDIYGMSPIEEAYDLLRKTENGVSTPHSKDNPFHYLQTMLPEFSDAVDLIIDFWSKFSNSNIRNLYNYIKHKGKPIYKEIEDIRGGKIIRLNIQNQEYPSDIRDVQKLIVLEDSIKELIDFDDNQLFPYINELINLLKNAINPSPMAYI